MLDHVYVFFFFNDTATTEIYTLSLHDALPIWSQRWLALLRAGHPIALRRRQRTAGRRRSDAGHAGGRRRGHLRGGPGGEDRKSTRLNSSHANISYAVFCLKKKKNKRSDHFYTR